MCSATICTAAREAGVEVDVGDVVDLVRGSVESGRTVGALAGDSSGPAFVTNQCRASAAAWRKRCGRRDAGGLGG